MAEYIGPERLSGLGKTFEEATEAHAGTPPDVTLHSKYDGEYPAYFGRLSSTQLLSIAERWAVDTPARIPLWVAAYEQTAKPMIRSRIAERLFYVTLGTEESSREAYTWAQRAIGAVTMGNTSFEALANVEQTRVSARFEELKTAFDPLLTSMPEHD